MIIQEITETLGVGLAAIVCLLLSTQNDNAIWWVSGTALTIIVVVKCLKLVPRLMMLEETASDASGRTARNTYRS